MNRNDLISTYRQRIQQGDRIKLSTDERAFLVADFIEQLQGLDSPAAIEELCQSEIQLLEEGYGVGTNSTTNYLSRYRKAIEDAVAAGTLKLTEQTTHHFSGRKLASGEPIETDNHLAWSLMRYDNEVYVRNRRATNVTNNQRQDQPQPFIPEYFLGKAEELLRETDAETLAIGIAAVTGRRHTEVAVSGKFTLTQHPYLLRFEGQLKKENPVAYPIVTLLPAEQVLEAITRFRALPEVQALEGLSSIDQPVKNFRARVNTRVKQHFQKTEILPLLPGFKSVSIHRLRAAYARMVIYYWLPNQGMNEQRFLQFYLGHVSAADMKDAPNAIATSHYFGYRLVKTDGKEIVVRGIKLASYGALPTPTQEQVEEQQKFDQILEALSQDTESDDNQEEPMPPVQQDIQEVAEQLEELPPLEHSKPSRSRIKALDVSIPALTTAADRYHLKLEPGKGKGYQKLLNQLLDTIAHEQPAPSLADELALMKQMLINTVAEQETRAILAKEVTSLQEQLQQSHQEQQRLQAELDTLTEFKQDYDRLQTELANTTSRLNQFLQLAAGALPATVTPAQPAPPTPEASAPPAKPSPSESPDTPLAQPAARKPLKERTRPKLSPDDRIQIAIDALMHHNEHCTDPNDRWYISTNVIADASGTNPAMKVKPWLAEHQEVAQQIEQHNKKMETTAAHHNRGKDKAELRSIYQTFEQAAS